jgi:hypothetical protein
MQRTFFFKEVKDSTKTRMVVGKEAMLVGEPFLWLSSLNSAWRKKRTGITAKRVHNTGCRKRQTKYSRV